jgi:hypothetical protein
MIISHTKLLTPPTVAVIVANLFPLVGLLFWGWDAFYVVLLYWAENVIIGFYTILKMFCAKADHAIERILRIFPAAFFMLHYGSFMGGHGLFVLASFKKNGAESLFGKEETWPFFLAFLHLFIMVLRYLFSILPREMLIILGGLFASHGLSFVYECILNGKYHSAKVSEIMMEPYPRIIPLHIAIIIGGMLSMALGSPIGVLIVLVILKTSFELRLRLKPLKMKDTQKKIADIN